jgi:hypothetical protein
MDIRDRVAGAAMRTGRVIGALAVAADVSPGFPTVLPSRQIA